MSQPEPADVRRLKIEAALASRRTRRAEARRWGSLARAAALLGAAAMIGGAIWAVSDPPGDGPLSDGRRRLQRGAPATEKRAATPRRLR